MKIRIILFALLISILLLSLPSCSQSEPPRLDDVKDRFVYLIEESKELNILFFGAGLPVYEREHELSERRQIYFNDDVYGYDIISEQSEYKSADQIKADAKKIFSSEYLSAIYESAFDGLVVGDSGAYIRFYDNGSNLYQNTYATDFKINERIYDYSTMKIIDPSNATYVNVSIDSYLIDDDVNTTVYLSFSYENGNWYLDSPTY